LVGLGPAIAIKVAAPPTSLVVESAPDRSKIGLASVPNESAKSDRLGLPHIRAEPEIMPTVQAVPVETPQAAPVETPSTKPDTIEGLSRRWRDANAKIAPPKSPHRRTITRVQEKSAGGNPPKARAEVWHCRQDAMGSLLRSLDLSPKCDL
jgi:hypothetical protein